MGFARPALVAVLVIQVSCAPQAAACRTVSGGEPGSVMQLRGMRFGDDQISFVFGLRAGGAPYGVPAHTVERAGETLRVRLPGARLLNPDGSPSYHGEREVRPPGTGIERVSVVEGGDGGIVLELVARGGGCPRVMSRRYGLGTTHPEALVSLSLRAAPAVVLDPDRGTAGFPMQVVGIGYSPDSPAVFQYGDRVVWTSQTDARGQLDTTLFVPTSENGWHRVLVRDREGATTAWFKTEPD